ncbi:hypothetical protein B0H11DRAFT_1919620 [Mycena galericulata]|nr:hypothetical protein B0H11DRAFT_1919620 [Mycena galericulata]
MALSCPTLPSSCAELNIDDYFDFDAASCNSSSPTAGWEFLHSQTACSPKDHENSMLTRLVLDRIAPDDAYQIKVDVAGIYAEAYHDYTLGLPLQTTQYSESSRCWSVPGSPSSFMSALSPPHSPISCGGDNAETDFGFSSDACGHPLRTPSPAPSYTVAPSELSTLGSCAEARTGLSPCSESISSLATIVHAPRPVSPRRDIVGSLETIVQSHLGLQMKYIPNQTEPPYWSNPSQAPRGCPQIIHLDFDERPPPRSPSCGSEGPVHRVGRFKKKASRKTRPVCPFPGCGVTATRMADIVRHCRQLHQRPCLPKIFRETGKDRAWCMGCLTILSRGDSRRRHENTCPHFAEYRKNGNIRNPMFLPLPEIYLEDDPNYRLWCLTCFTTFTHPDERHTHEEKGCKGAIIDKSRRS